MFAGFAPSPGEMFAIFAPLVAAVFAILIVSYMAAAVGAPQGPTVLRRTLVLVCGWLFGVVMATTAGWVVLEYYVESLGGFSLVPVVSAVVGGATAFTVARSVTSFITRYQGWRMKKLNEQAERLRQKGAESQP